MSAVDMIALHEAGHAVTATLLGIPIASVTARPVGHDAGQTVLGASRMPRDDYVKVNLGGLAATGLDAIGGVGVDVMRALRACDGDWVPVLRRLAETQELLTRHAAALDAVAAAVRCRDLTGQDVMALVEVQGPS